MDAPTLLAGLLIVVGLAGIVVPILPGLVLVWGGVLLWAVTHPGGVAWAVLAVATALAVAGSVIKYLWPGRRLRAAGIGWPTLAAGALLGIAGFFVIPVVGLFAGFILGVFLAEYSRLRDGSTAWTATRQALAAVGWSVLIELAAALFIVGVWLAALIFG